MRSLSLLHSTSLFLVVTASSWAQSSLRSAVEFSAPSQSRWSVSAGFSARRIKSQTGLGSAAMPDARLLGSVAPGRGDLGFYSGGEAIQYDDGVVGTGGLRVAGSALITDVYVEAAGQVHYAFLGEIPREPGGDFLEPFYDITLHSTQTRVGRSLQCSAVIGRTDDGGWICARRLDVL